MKKQRLDNYLAALHPELSRTQLQSLIMQGKVVVNGDVATKPGTQVSDADDIVANLALPKFASRAGLKLEAALDAFGIDPTNLIILNTVLLLNVLF